MRKRVIGRGQKRRSRRALEEGAPEQGEAAREAARTEARVGAMYSSGPVFGLTPTGTSTVSLQELAVSLAALRGAGQTHREAAYGRTLRLQGRTDGFFDGGRFHTENVKVRSAQRCAECGGKERIHVTGTLVIAYHVRTQVSLPRASGFPGLTRCQRQRVQDAIDNILIPHEQQHVAAFETYNGTVRIPFDLTLCRSEFDESIRSMFQADEAPRRAAAQAASDALDPFYFDVDLDCEEPQQPGRRTSAAAPTATPAAAEPAAEPTAEATPAVEPAQTRIEA